MISSLFFLLHANYVLLDFDFTLALVEILPDTEELVAFHMTSFPISCINHIMISES